MVNLRRRLEMEKIIGDKLVDLLIEAGYDLSIDNGGDCLELPWTRDAAEVKAAMRATDDEMILARKDGVENTVKLVYGNSGWDVINDYSCYLSPIIDKLDDMTAEFEKEDT